MGLGEQFANLKVVDSGNKVGFVPGVQVGDSVNVGTAVLSWTIVLALDGLNSGSFDGGILG